MTQPRNGQGQFRKRRPLDPFKNNSTMTAAAVMVRTKAQSIEDAADYLMRMAKSDETYKFALRMKMRAEEIIEIVEGD